jgi:hypothetical protein
MSKRIAVPAELEHMLEKRDDEKNRRGPGRRGSARSKSGEASAKPERRKKSDRRGKKRRKSDS